MIVAYEVVQTVDSAGWRLGNSIELESKEDAIEKIKRGDVKLLDYPRYAYPLEWESNKKVSKNIQIEE
jgi:hypothetical protein